MTVRIRHLRGGDLPAVLTLERHAFADDAWTIDSAHGWLAQLLPGGPGRGVLRVAQLLRLIRLARAIRLACFVTLGRPATRSYLVAEKDGTIAGYATLDVAGGTGSVQAIAVAPDCQGGGIGRVLLADLIANAAACEAKEIFLNVRADNTRARQLYERTGFTEVEVCPGYYQPSGADAVVMRLPVPAGPASVARQRGPGIPMPIQLTSVASAAAVAAGAAGLGLALAGVDSAVRATLVLLFLAVAPTAAAAGLLRTLDGFARLIIACTADITILALTAIMMLAVGTWSPTGGLLAVMVITAVGWAAQWAPVRRAVRVRRGPGRKALAHLTIRLAEAVIRLAEAAAGSGAAAAPRD
jgi:[ribosomal protein S18]-alanine N-acetyltransferase